MLASLTLFALAPLLPAQEHLVDAEAAPRPTVVRFSRPGPAVRPARRVAAQTLTTALVPLDAPPEGDMPRELTFTPDGQSVVVVNRDTDNLVFIDFASSQITDTVPVGDFPVDVAVSPDGAYVVTADVFSDTVTVIDAVSHALVASVPVTGTQPYSVTITPDSAYAVVGVIQDGVNSTYSVIDLTTFSEIRVIPSAPQGVIGFFFNSEYAISGNIFTQWELTPDGTRIVQPVLGTSGGVRVMDVASGATLATVPTPPAVAGIAVSLDSTLAVVTHEGSSPALTVIDLTTFTASATLPVSVTLMGGLVRITPSNTHAFVGGLNAVHFIELASGAVTSTISTATPGDIELTHDHSAYFVSSYTSLLIDIATQSQLAAMTVAPSREAAVSPVSGAAATLNNWFGEDVHLYTLAGGSSSVHGVLLSGAPPEADNPRAVAVTPDGTRAVVGMELSDSLAVVDLATGTAIAYPDAGRRVLDVAVTPDGQWAVSADADGNVLSVIDLGTHTRVAAVPLPSRPSRVAVSPDSSAAYVTTVAGSDRLWKVHLAGAASAVVASLTTGQMGVAWGYSFGEFSGLALSSDGSLVAVCASFDDQVQLVNTSTMTALGSLATGAFPIRARFSDDGSRLYTLNMIGDSLTAIDVVGGTLSLAGTVPGIHIPSTVDVDPSGAFVYVGNVGSAPGLRVIDATSLAAVATLPLDPVREARLDPATGVLYLLTEDAVNASWNLVRVQATGASSSVLDVTALDDRGIGLARAPQSGRVVVTLPWLDALDVLTLDPFSSFCVGAPNSAGPGAAISASGSASLAGNDTVLHVDGAIAGQFGLFFYGPNAIQVPFGNGFRCVGGGVFRLNPPLLPDGIGAASRALDLTAPAAASGPGQITAGSTWRFQFWYRDPAAGGAGFNLSDGLEATFGP